MENGWVVGWRGKSGECENCLVKNNKNKPKERGNFDFRAWGWYRNKHGQDNFVVTMAHARETVCECEFECVFVLLLACECVPCMSNSNDVGPLKK